jgi:hypothetical protein
MIRPYDPMWYRRLDFLPPMGLQIAVGEKDLELYYCYCSVSVKESTILRTPKVINTEFGTLKVNPVFRNRVDYKMGNLNPRNGVNPIPQREILRDIEDKLGGAVEIIGNMPDVVIQSRGVVEKIPKEVEKLVVFQGSEYIFYHQNAYGNFPHKVRQVLRVGVANPYDFIKHDLLKYRILKLTNDPVLKKLRSTLKTEWLITDTQGYNSIGNTGILELERALIRTRWWTDIGKPTQFQIPLNSGIQGQIYQLLRRKCIVVV